MNRFVKFTLPFVFSIFALPAFTQVAQWRGPERDGKYPDKGLLQGWPDNGPKLVLKKAGLGAGWSTPVISDNTIFVTGRRDTIEVLTALKMDGTVLWETVYGKPWLESFPDTRDSPTIEGDMIFVEGAMGEVNCINKKTGKIIWMVNTHEKFKGEFHRWGFAESLLLTDKAVISSPVGNLTTLVALDKKDGSLLWKTESIGDVRSYVSPLLINYKGTKYILSVTASYILAVNPDNGAIVWKFDFVKGFAPDGDRINTNTPLYKDGEIFVTSGYDCTAVMLKLSEDGKSVSLKWSSDVLDTHHGGDVLVNGYIYGPNWINNGNGNWVCLDWNTGEVKYNQKWFNKGSIIFADGKLYLYEEKEGHIGLVEPDPSGFKLISSFKITDGAGPQWAHPSIYNGYLLIRHGEVLMVYDIQNAR
jgi:outer membrane protein assembly factor BamB